MQTDVLIIGGGLSGITAAYEVVRSSGLRVDVLQWGEGASPFIHGFCLPIGEGDSEKLLYEDTVESGCRQSRESLVRRLCRDSLELQRYFAELGLEVDSDENGYLLTTSLGSAVPRIASIKNAAGPALLNALRRKLAACSQYREHYSCRALELIKRDGRVTGALCYDKKSDSFWSFGAKVIILATGGFGRLFQESTNSADIGGDGCAMAYLAGTKMTDMEFIQFEPSAAVWPPELMGKSVSTTMFYEGAVLRNKAGERFMTRYSDDGECVSKDLLSKYIAHELRNGNGTPHGGVWFDATSVPKAMWDSVYRPYLDRYLACGIDMRIDCVEIAPAAHTTCGGVLIDNTCRTGAPGLLACGEAAGGLHGANRLGGNAGLETLVFGRAAGGTAIQECAGLSEPVVIEQGFPNAMPVLNVDDLQRQLQSVLHGCLNVFRTATQLEDGIQAVDVMLTQVCEQRRSFCERRLYNDLLTARIAMTAALGRKESIGCHCREDAEPFSGAYRTIVQNQGEGFSLSYEAI